MYVQSSLPPSFCACTFFLFFLLVSSCSPHLCNFIQVPSLLSVRGAIIFIHTHLTTAVQCRPPPTMCKYELCAAVYLGRLLLLPYNNPIPSLPYTTLSRLRFRGPRPVVHVIFHKTSLRLTVPYGSRTKPFLIHPAHPHIHVSSLPRLPSTDSK